MTHLRRPVDEARDVTALRRQVAELLDRVEQLELTSSSLDERVDEVEGALTEAMAEAGPAVDRAPTEVLPPPAPPQPLVDLGAVLDDLQVTTAAHGRHLQALEAALGELRSQRAGTRSESADLHRTIELVGAQVRTLAAQTAEVRADVEVVRRMMELHPGVDPMAFEEVRTNMARLAHEQARMELAFREDLASLADRVRRAGQPS